jgi:hypothetical protein
VTDVIRFKFDGKLADDHRMDFYESARFQYAASRLCIKLDRFRREGSFPKKITNVSNTGLQLTTYKEGSFGIEVAAPILVAVAPLLVEVPLSAMWTYVIERIFRPADSGDVQAALATQRHLIDSYDRTIKGQEEMGIRTLDLLQAQIARKEELSAENAALYERLLAEQTRRAFLEGKEQAFRQITPEQDARLVTMAAPLLSELIVPLRKSANRATIIVGEEKAAQPILSATKQMAEEIETAIVDPQLNNILIDIVQYDKESGWGKFRNPEFDGKASFSVPADRKDRLRKKLTDAMNNDKVYVQAYYVKSVSGERLRLIIVDIIDLDALEQG